MDKKYKKFVDFLKVIDAGVEIKIDGNTYVKGYDDENNEPLIAMKMYRYVNGEDGEGILMEPPILQDFNGMINFINKNVDDAELEGAMLNVALNAAIKHPSRST